MSDQGQSVWPDGAREAVDKAFRSWWDNPWNYQACATDLLTALEPFVQQRIEAALSDIDEMVPPAIGIYQTIPDRVRLVIDQRDEAESIVADLRAEVARLREDGERLDWLERQGANAITTRAAIDAARSAPGGEG